MDNKLLQESRKAFYETFPCPLGEVAKGSYVSPVWDEAVEWALKHLTQWRSVKDDPPEHNQVVLVCYDFADNDPRVMVYDAEDGTFFCELTSVAYARHTHWMPLPKPYQKPELPGDDVDWKPEDL